MHIAYEALEEGDPQREKKALRLCICRILSVGMLLIVGSLSVVLWLRSHHSSLLKSSRPTSLAESDNNDGQPLLIKYFFWPLAVVFVLCALISPCVNCINKYIIEKMDRHILNVDVHIKSLSTSIWSRSIVINSLKIDNPVDHGFKSNHLLQAKRVEFGVRVWRLLKTRGREVEIKWLRISNLDVNCEFISKSGAKESTSNIGIVSNFLLGVDKLTSTPSNARMQQSTKRLFLLREVDIESIILNVRGINDDAPLAAKLDDERHADFIKEKGKMTLEQLMRTLVGKLLKRASDAGNKTWMDSFMESKAVDLAKHAVENTMKHISLAANAIEAKRISARMEDGEDLPAGGQSDAKQDLDRLKKALVQSGLRVEHLCASDRLSEEDFKNLAELTATIDPKNRQDAYKLLVSGEEHYGSVVSKKHFKRWIEGNELRDGP